MDKKEQIKNIRLDNKLEQTEVLKLLRIERNRQQDALLKAHIAQSWLNYATTPDHFETVCKYISHTQEAKNLEYKKLKTLGGVFFEYEQDEEQAKLPGGSRAWCWCFPAGRCTGGEGPGTQGSPASRSVKR